MRTFAPQPVRPVVARRRRAFTFLEIVLSIGMLATLLLITGQIVVQLKRQTVAAERYSQVLDAAENGLEELMVRPWSEVNDEAIASLQVPAPLSEKWPEAKFTGTVANISEPVEAKRITLKFSLTPESPRNSATLATWIYRTPQD